MPTHPLVLGDRDVSYLLKSLDSAALHSIIRTLSLSFQQLSTLSDKVHQPHRQSISTGDGFTTLFMPSSNTAATAVKTVTLDTATPTSPKATLTIFDRIGQLQGVLNAEKLTAFRTALASLILLLKRIEAGNPVKNITFFGTGNQAQWALSLCMNLIPGLQNVTIVGHSTVQRSREVLPAARRLNEVVKWSLSSPDCKFLALAPEQGSDFDTDLRKAIRASDAIFCCTPATAPLFPKQYLAPEKSYYISLIGSYKAGMKEIVPSYLNKEDVKVVVDSRAACLKEAGEIIEAGLNDKDLIEIGELVGEGYTLGKEYRGNLVFKCVGLAIMDLAVGVEVLKLAREKRETVTDLGVELPFFA